MAESFQRKYVILNKVNNGSEEEFSEMNLYKKKERVKTMKEKITYELTEADIKLLKEVMPVASKDLVTKRKELEYIGCPEERELERAQRPYKDAGIYKFASLKSNLIMASKIGDYEEIKKAYVAYFIIESDIRKYLDNGIEDMLRSIEKYLFAYDNLRATVPYIKTF